MHYMELMLKVTLHIDDTLPKTMPDINQALLQFIDIMTWQTCCCIFPICVINDAGDKWRIRLCVGIRMKV